MSFKYAAEKISDFEWILQKGVSIPINVFMNQFLYDNSEEEMWRQATWATNIPSVQQIIITPDAHVGAGVPIGIVVATKDHVAPCAAGFDISCGMCSIKTNLNFEHVKSKEIRRSWINAVEKRISLGIGKERVEQQIEISEKLFKEILQYGLLALQHVSSNHAFQYSIKNDLDKFEKTHHEVREYVHYEKAFNRGKYQLSSLGGGNHFLELQRDQDDNIWIMIHTGSRGYGHQIATDFFNEGLDWWNSSHEKQLSKGQKELVNFPVDSDIGKRYLNAMNQAANFAIVNHYLIAQAVCDATREVFLDLPEIFYEISHNLVQQENGLWVHRKGATRALPANHCLLKETKYKDSGHPVLIPGSMGTSSAILIPNDSKKSLYSVNHGCGRVIGRGAAKRKSDEKDSTTSQKILDQEMDDLDILYNTRHVPIDESLHCYKDIDQVLETVEGSNLAKVIVKLRPIAVIKGND